MNTVTTEPTYTGKFANLMQPTETFSHKVKIGNTYLNESIQRYGNPPHIYIEPVLQGPFCENDVTEHFKNIINQEDITVKYYECDEAYLGFQKGVTAKVFTNQIADPFMQDRIKDNEDGDYTFLYEKVDPHANKPGAYIYTFTVGIPESYDLENESYLREECK